MRMYHSKTEFHCGVDLHKSMSYICVMNREGKILTHQKINGNNFDYMEKVLTPYLHSLTIACESTYNWYILADFVDASESSIDFVLGHALYMKSIHGGKAKNDRIDSKKIADLLRANLLPQSYACPQIYRGHRDLMRRRLKLIRDKSGISVYLTTLEQQNGLNQSTCTQRGTSKGLRELLDFQDFTGKNIAIETNYKLNHKILSFFHKQLKDIDKVLLNYCIESHFKDDFIRIKTIPGIGDILGMTILYEMHDINRFPTVGQFASYSRVVKCSKESAGKNYGFSGTKIGNAFLKWAFGQTAVLAKRNKYMKVFTDDLDKKYGKRKARSIFEHKIARAVFFMLKREEPFDPFAFYGKDKFESLRKRDI